jgi:hypothetical protein
MIKELWLNLPVKDVKRAKTFFTHLGFAFSNRHKDGEPMAGLIVGERKTMVMLIEENLFKSFTGNELTDTSKSNETLISFDAESPEEVDRLAKKAEEAGGKVFGKPGWNQGWMYGCGFTDLDGHRWNVLHMDMNKMS